MKLAFLIMLCLLASAFNVARSQGQGQQGTNQGGVGAGGNAPLPDDGLPDDGEFGDYEPEDPLDGPGDGEDDGLPPQGLDGEDDGVEGGDVDGDLPNTKDNVPAAGHHGRFNGFHGHHHRRRHHHHHHGGFRHFRHRHHFRHGHGGGRVVDRSTCSVEASYFLTYNGERRYCRYATDDHDDCQACCEAATRRETRGVDKDDIIGFITKNRRGNGHRGRSKREAYAAGGDKHDDKHDDKYDRHDGPDEECVCCIPKHTRY